MSDGYEPPMALIKEPGAEMSCGFQPFKAFFPLATITPGA
jgi:hypothetical protein